MQIFKHVPCLPLRGRSGRSLVLLMMAWRSCTSRDDLSFHLLARNSKTKDQRRNRAWHTQFYYIYSLRSSRDEHCRDETYEASERLLGGVDSFLVETTAIAGCLLRLCFFHIELWDWIIFDVL